jgi:inosine/xanthosine triphosphate pyrophosphatase family protein
MSREEKNSVSHRGKAMTKLRDDFDKVMIWLSQQ